MRTFTREQLINAMIDVNKNIYRRTLGEHTAAYESRMFVLSRFHIDELIKHADIKINEAKVDLVMNGVSQPNTLVGLKSTVAYGGHVVELCKCTDCKRHRLTDPAIMNNFKHLKSIGVPESLKDFYEDRHIIRGSELK